MDYSDDDISWLTQEPSQSSQMEDFSVVHSYIEEDIKLDYGNQVVSLEEGDAKFSVLYDNVVAQDISTEDEGNGM